VPGGRGALTQLLPAVRKVTEVMMTRAIDRDRIAGNHVSCKAGCAACCRHLVPVSLVEARSIADVVAKMPKPKRDALLRRIKTVLEKLEAAELIEPRGPRARSGLIAKQAGGEGELWNDVSSRYQALQLDCIFLENKRCSIYADRPIVCREHLATTPPERCDTGEGARSVPRPMYMTQILANVVEVLDGVGPRAVPLPLALEWMAEHEDELGRDHSGAEALEVLIDAFEPSGES
jgi:Fe-S-cluster containining protein